jgi:hypothetical protein
MQRATWGIAWLALASMLAVGGCPSGAVDPVVRAGVPTGIYTGTLSCRIIGHSPDWTTVLDESFVDNMSLSVAEDGTLTVNGVPYFSGAMRVYMANNSRIVTDTIADIVSDEDDTYTQGPTSMTLSLPAVYTVSGDHVLVFEGSGSDSVAASYYITASSDDFSLSQECLGTLTP